MWIFYVIIMVYANEHIYRKNNAWNIRKSDDNINTSISEVYNTNKVNLKIERMK